MIPPQAMADVYWLQLLFSWTPIIAAAFIDHAVNVWRFKRRSAVQRLFLDRSISARIDVAYFLMYKVVFKHIKLFATLIIPAGLAVFILELVRGHFEFNGILGDYMPESSLLMFIITLMAIDFPLYVAHVAMHRVPFLWRMHRLHHSASEMNLITGNRISLSEHFLTDLFSIFFLSILIGLPETHIIAPVVFLRSLIDMLQHSDVPFDYGPLDRLIASPRFHRMHHSNDPADFDANYGNIFSFWDHIFGTVAYRYKQSRKTADHCTLGVDDSYSDTRLGWLSMIKGVSLAEIWQSRKNSN